MGKNAKKKIQRALQEECPFEYQFIKLVINHPTIGDTFYIEWYYDVEKKDKCPITNEYLVTNEEWILTMRSNRKVHGRITADLLSEYLMEHSKKRKNMMVTCEVFGEKEKHTEEGLENVLRFIHTYQNAGPKKYIASERDKNIKLPRKIIPDKLKHYSKDDTDNTDDIPNLV